MLFYIINTMIIPNNIEEVDKLIEDKSNIILLDFYANWCGPCKRQTPKLEEMENQFTNIKFLKINVDELDELSEKYSITCMPTIIFIKDSEIYKRIEGCNIEEISNILHKL